MNFTCLRLLCVISFYETWFVLHYKYEYYSTVILYTDVYFMYSYAHTQWDDGIKNSAIN